MWMNLNKEFKKGWKNYKNSLNNYDKEYITDSRKMQEKLIDRIRQKQEKCKDMNTFINIINIKLSTNITKILQKYYNFITFAKSVEKRMLIV